MNQTSESPDAISNTMAIERTSAGPLQVAETAHYLADMLLELRNLAKSSNLKTLQGILEIAYYEAYAAANKIVVPEGEIERLQNLGHDARKAEAG